MPKHHAQRVGNHRLDRADHRHLSAAADPGAPGDESFGRADREVGHQADPGSREDRRDAAEEEERNDRDKRPQAGRNHRGERGGPGIGEALLREAQFFVRHRAQKLLRLLREASRQQMRLLLAKAFQLVHQRKLLALLLRVLLDLAALAGNLRLVDLALALRRQVRAGAHRERAGQHTRQAANQHDLAGRAGRARHAADNAEDRAQAIVRAIDRIAQPAAAAFVPALAAQHHIEHALRADRLDNLANHAPVTLLLASHLAQHLLSLQIVNRAGLGLVARDIAVLLALHVAQSRLRADLATHPALETHAPGAPLLGKRRAQLDQFALPLLRVPLLRLRHLQQHAPPALILLARGQVAIRAHTLDLALPVLVQRLNQLALRGLLQGRACRRPAIFLYTHAFLLA